MLAKPRDSLPMISGWRDLGIYGNAAIRTLTSTASLDQASRVEKAFRRSIYRTKIPPMRRLFRG